MHGKNNSDGRTRGFRAVMHRHGSTMPDRFRGVWSPLKTGLLGVVVSVLMLASAIACDAIEDVVSQPTPTASATRAATVPTATMVPAPSERPSVSTIPSASGILLPVSISPVPVDRPKYDRSTWRHWTDEDGDCQNARQEVLLAESVVEVAFQSADGCRVATGRWTGPYTGEVVTDPGDLDIDHLVPLENAHRSGAWAWDRERKREYANFLGDEDHLIATTSSANRSKGSKGPEAWRPPLESYWCTYAVNWVQVKNDWGLTVTESEYTALSEMLSTCEKPVLLQPTQGSAPPLPTATIEAGPVSATRPATSPATPPATPPGGLRYDPFGPDRNCGDFDTYDEALAFFLAAGGPDQDRHRLDVNGDGKPCESLPGGPSAQESPESPDTGMALYAAVPASSGNDSGGCLPTGLPGAKGQPTPGTRAAGGEQECPPDVEATPPPLPPESTQAQSASTPAPIPSPTPETTPTSTPSATPAPTQRPAPVEQAEFSDRDCSDFAEWREAQNFYLEEGGPEHDPHGLDGDGDGIPCQSLTGAPAGESPTPAPTPTPAATPDPTPEPTPASAQHEGLPFDPTGPDRDCSDFQEWWDAQNFFLAAGGPDEDPHRLDHNGDGEACESLPGAPKEAPPPADSGQGSSSSQSSATQDDGFQDRNCGDFDTWQEAQEFYESEGGPTEDPHRLDRDKDGVACESLPGAPEEDS